MTSDFWAGYLSGALGIVIGNPLDVVKVRLQAGDHARASALQPTHFERLSSLVRGTIFDEIPEIPDKKLTLTLHFRCSCSDPRIWSP